MLLLTTQLHDDMPAFERALYAAPKLPDGAGGWWLLDRAGRVCGMITPCTFRDLNAVYDEVNHDGE